MSSGWALAAIAGIVVAYAVVSRRLDRTPITAAIFFVSCGLLFGNKGLGWIDLGTRAESVRLLAEATLTLVLFADASRIDLPALRREYLVPARLLGIGLPLTILVGFALAAGLFGQLSVGEALLLAIILAPTDAALGQVVVTDQRLPSRIRQGLNVESGLNDGICVPLLFIALALSGSEAQLADHPGRVRAGRQGDRLRSALRRHRRRGRRVAGAGRPCSALMDVSWVQVVPVGTAALAYGLASPLGGSGFIAAFVAGFVFGAIIRAEDGIESPARGARWARERRHVHRLRSRAVGPILSGMTWTAALYGVLSLTVARMLPVAVAFAGTRARLQTVAFTGWFGPRGLASIVFTVIVLDETKLPYDSTIALVAVFTIVLSVYAHGLTSRPLTARYAAWYRAHPRDRRPVMEAVHAEPQRWRRSPAVRVPAVSTEPRR